MSLQASIDSLVDACRRADIDIYTLLDKPIAQVLAFARTHGISIPDLREICVLLIERLDAWDQDLERVGRSALH